jgi:hypothetical protein
MWTRRGNRQPQRKHDPARERFASTETSLGRDPRRGMSAGTVRNVELDPTRGRSAGTVRNMLLDPTRPTPRRKTVTGGEDG